ncbi:hypothetical protein LJC63_06315 [Ruminococcaceae bacterium OttesenSCG-928-L11]|nr:hypothetical protein [Ruminococcaceae bacterium OttesenSCG-928-L11]
MLYVISFILTAPFALLFFYRNFNLSQDFFRHSADRSAKGVNAGGRVEIEDRLKILIRDIFGGVDPAAGHQAVRHADRQGFTECDFDIQFVKIFEKTALDTVTDVRLVILIVARRKLMRKAKNYITHIIADKGAAVNTVPAHEAVYVISPVNGFNNGLFMLRFQFPHKGLSGVLPAVLSVGNIKNIAKPGLIARLVNEGDTL